jgi:hypothetical protein
MALSRQTFRETAPLNAFLLPFIHLGNLVLGVSVVFYEIRVEVKEVHHCDAFPF